jgi:hypothetical protein
VAAWEGAEEEVAAPDEEPVVEVESDGIIVDGAKPTPAPAEGPVGEPVRRPFMQKPLEQREVPTPPVQEAADGKGQGVSALADALEAPETPEAASEPDAPAPQEAPAAPEVAVPQEAPAATDVGAPQEAATGQAEPVAEEGITPPEMPPIVVKFEEPISYAPARYDPSGAKPLPGAHPFARAGQTEAMGAPPIPPQEVPKLEPAANLPPPPPIKPIGRQEPPPAEEEEPKEKERPPRRRRGKGDKGKESRKRGKEPPAPEEKAPEAQDKEEDDSGWKLEDIIGHGTQKGKEKPS